MLNLTISLYGSTTTGPSAISEPVTASTENNMVYVYDFPGLGTSLQPINVNNISDQINVLQSMASRASNMLSKSLLYLTLEDIQSRCYLWSYTANDLYNLLENLIYIAVSAVNAVNKPISELTAVDVAPYINNQNITVAHVMQFLNSATFSTIPLTINQTTEEYINVQFNFVYQVAKSLNKPMSSLSVSDIQTYMDTLFKTNPGVIATLPSATQLVNLVNTMEMVTSEIATKVNKNQGTINLSDIHSVYVDNAKITANNVYTYVGKLSNLQTFGITGTINIDISALGFFVKNSQTFVWIKLLFTVLLSVIILFCFINLVVGSANSLKFAFTTIMALFIILQVMALGFLPSSKATSYTFLALFITQIIITIAIACHPMIYNTAECNESLSVLGLISICDALVLGACSAVLFNNDNLILPTNNNLGVSWMSSIANNIAYYFNMLSLKYYIK